MLKIDAARRQVFVTRGKSILLPVSSSDEPTEDDELHLSEKSHTRLLLPDPVLAVNRCGGEMLEREKERADRRPFFTLSVVQ